MYLPGLSELQDGDEYLTPHGWLRKSTLPDGSIAVSLESNLGKVTIVYSVTGVITIQGDAPLIQFLRSYKE